MTARQYSVSPSGEKFPLPLEADYKAEFGRLKKLAAAQRKQGREIVVVVGVGFVGAVMAAVVADSTDEDGKPRRFVIGMQRPSPRSFWKIHLLNRGLSPVKSEDPEVDVLIERCVKQKKTLCATYTYDALSLADVVVVDVQCDYHKEALGDCRNGAADMVALESALTVIAEKIPAEALVLIETTVAPGTTEQVAYPIMKKVFAKRGITSEPLLAHSYERVMPGRHYVSSIRDFWRVCSGVNGESRNRVARFLSEILNVKEFPLTVLDRPIESETAKIVENSYRATILAFLDEWSLFSERNGVDLKKVIEAIKVRPTHSNIIFPGPGIGGYCLPKDGGLGVWAYRHIHGWEDDIFRITPLAIDINDTRALHAAQLTRDALRNMGRPTAAADILLLGAAYREDVGDTRYSGSELIVRRLTEMGAEIRVHDPYVEHWWELEDQDAYPSPGSSKGRFFHRQAKLKELRVEKDLWKSMKGVDALILAVRHKPYQSLEPDRVVEAVGGPCAVIDCFCLLDDDRIRRYFELGCEVKGMGRGHIQRIKESVRKKVRILDPLAEPRWDERLLVHDDASIFHTAAWARVLRESYGYSCCYLAETAGDRFSFLLPLMDVRSLLTGRRGISLPFTDSCEPLLEVDSPAPAALDSLIALGRQRGWQYFEIRGGERMFAGAQPALTVLTHSLGLAPSEEALFAGLKESTRRNIRRAKREGVEVRIGIAGEMVDSFYRLNCLTRREHGLPPQPLKFFRKIHAYLLESGLGFVALATLHGRSIAGAVYLHFGREALYKYGASDRCFLALRPNDLVMWEAIRWCRARGFRRVDFGRTECRHEGLRRYKLGWGVEEREKPYFRYGLKAGAFVKAGLKDPGPTAAVFRRLPIFASRAIGELLYRHVA